MTKLTSPFLILPLSVSPPLHVYLLPLVFPGLDSLSTHLSLICPTLLVGMSTVSLDLSLSLSDRSISPLVSFPVLTLSVLVSLTHFYIHISHCLSYTEWTHLTPIFVSCLSHPSLNSVVPLTPEAEFLDENQSKVLRVFLLPLQLCIGIYISSNSRNLLQFYNSVTVQCKGKRRKTC